MHKEKPKIEQPKEERKKEKDPFEWKSIWDEESALFEEDY
ncbi:hypothetical protein TERMP_01454 [Thermococcus barophilus MP]|uniref:Uncharacterized protein n=2 Tax=Thermococcus barophilus TaxID=55802 RepID=F0LI99_THEBM|nr:hypothetical protein TERMP_01454 [Thermococcus barophilus MP]